MLVQIMIGTISMAASCAWAGGDKTKALSYDSFVNERSCKIVFPSKELISSKNSEIDFCGRSILRDQVSGWTYFVNRGGWAQSFMTSITLGINGKFESFIVEFKNSEPHTSFLKSFGKWQSNLDPYD